MIEIKSLCIRVNRRAVKTDRLVHQFASTTIICYFEELTPVLLSAARSVRYVFVVMAGQITSNYVFVFFVRLMNNWFL